MDVAILNKQLRLWPELAQSVVENYDICWACNLAEYDHNIFQLWYDLLPYKSYSFNSKQRLIFTLYDIDYYLPGMKIGFTLENVLRILQDLDISTNHCLLLTNYPGLGNNINQITNSSIMVHENHFYLSQSTCHPPLVEKTASYIHKHFCFMSNIRRDHRSLTRLWLEKNNLLPKSILAWHAHGIIEYHNPSWDGKKLNYDPNQVPLQLVTVTPNAKINDKIRPIPELTTMYDQYHPVLDKTVIDPAITSDPNADNFNAPWLSQVFVNIVAETAFDYPYVYLTEKTFKCFWHHTPFVLIGPAGSLGYLKKLGFKTFDRWFDESYDTVLDAPKRMLSIFKSLDEISNWSIDHCRTVYNDMKEVLDHNDRHYREYFCKDLLQQKIKELLTQ